MNHSQFRKTEKIQVGIMIFIFIGMVPSLLFFYWGISHVNIYKCKNEYKLGVFVVEKIKCDSDTGGGGRDCIAYGKVNNLSTEVHLGLYLGTGRIHGEEEYANLGKIQFEVFYKPNGKQTLLKKENESKFNAVFYLEKGILELLLPLIIMPFLVFYYKHLTKKLKQFKDE